MRRLVAIAALLLGLGYGATEARDLLVSRGADPDTAASAVQQAQAGRDTVERVLVAVPLAQLAAAGADVAPIICGPPPDGGDSSHTDCLAANGEDTFSERYCRDSDGVEVARGGEVAVTPEMRDRFLADRDPSINYTFVRGQSINKKAELAARGLHRCTAAELGLEGP